MQFSIQELFRFGWEKTKSDFWFLFLMQVGILVVSGAASAFWPVSVIVGVLVSVSAFTLALRMTDGGVGTWHDLFAKYGDWRLFFNYLVASVVTAIITGIGFLLLVVPGVYFLVRTQFYKVLIVDKGDIGPWEAVKESWRITDGLFWRILGFSVVALLLNLGGFLALGVGLFVTIPVSLFAYTKLYRELHTRLLPQSAGE